MQLPRSSSFLHVPQTPSVSIDRLFTLAGNGTIDSSGTFGNNIVTAAGAANNATLIFNNTTNSVAFAGAAGARWTPTTEGAPFQPPELARSRASGTGSSNYR